jgi:lipopolysaccharide/colanic/teichoic acid biosynthesis glycosyltransferase
MTSSIIPDLQNDSTVNQQQLDSPVPYCTLHWRRGQLLVKPVGEVKQPYLASLCQERSLVECLKFSPTNLVRIDPKLGKSVLLFWANACAQANKPIFLRIPSINKQPKQSSLLLKLWVRLIEWMIALMMLVLLSPAILVLMALMRVNSPTHLLSYEWHVGERGKLFRTRKFRTVTSDNQISSESQNEQGITSFGRSMQKYSLENLPLLLNVLRGDMSLFGPRCWTLEEAVYLSLEGQQQLNRKPGTIGSWQVEGESTLLHLDSQTL